MRCACIYNANVDDFSEVLSEKWVKAKKDHVCCECRETIPKGAEYYIEKTAFDGLFATHKTCADCKSIRDHLVCDFYYEQILEGVRDSIMEARGEVSEDCLALLTPRARAMVCKWIEHEWESIEEDE